MPRPLRKDVVIQTSKIRCRKRKINRLLLKIVRQSTIFVKFQSKRGKIITNDG